jgi:hypothetical protein
MLNRNKKIKDVFKTVGTPTVTYVERDNGKFEKLLTNALQTEGKLCLLTGPSKTGKTVLYNKIVKKLNLQPLVVRCDDSISTDEFWKKALEKINFDRVTQNSKGDEFSISTGIKGRAEFGWKWVANVVGEINLGMSGKETESEIREKVLSSPSPDHLIPILKETNFILIIEDFHYLKEGIQKSIFQQWKAFVDSEISVIIVGTTHHAVDIAFANKDLVGRINHIELSTWSQKDLSKIVTQGFEYLKVDLENEFKNLISTESVGLPILTQECCLQLFFDKGELSFNTKQSKKLNFSKKEVYKSIHNVASLNYSSFSTFYEVFSTGFRKRARKYNTYELLLLIFSIDPITFSLEKSLIIKRLKSLSDKFKTPPLASITATLNNIQKFQLKNGIELLEWVPRQGKLFIVEPSFLFYLRWKDERYTKPSIKEVMDELIKKIQMHSKEIDAIFIKQVEISKKINEKLKTKIDKNENKE